MVAMPYILVSIISGIFWQAWFCLTSAALLSQYPSAGFYLPAKLRGRRLPAFIAHGLVMAVLSTVATRVLTRLLRTFLYSLFLFDWFFFISLLNSMVLVYQFLDKRYFLKMPKIWRRLFIALLSIVITIVPAMAVVIAILVLFIIK